MHWLYAAFFFVLLATGLVLWIPALSAAFGQRAVLRQVHIVTGIALVIVPLVIAATDGRRSVRTWLEIDRFDGEDWRFLRRRPAATGRFNAGQKLNTVFTITAAALFFVSGVVQWQWARFPGGWRTGASELHDLLTVVSAVVVLGHIWMGAGNPSTRHSLRGMVRGSVRREWAERHHPAWDDDSGDDSGPPC